MKFIDSWCPLCIRRICYAISQFFGIKKKKSYEGTREFYEDEAQSNRITDTEKDALVIDFKQGQPTKHSNPHPYHNTHKPPSAPKLVKPEVKVNTEELFENIEKDVLLETKRVEPEPKPTVVTEDLLSSTMSTEDETVRIKPRLEQIVMPPPVERVAIETGSFRINLEPYEKYYGLLEQKSQNLKDKLNIPGTVVPLEKTGNTDLEIRHAQPDKINIFVYSFKLPCTYSFYNGMLNDYGLQQKLDNNIDEYKMLQLITNNARVNYLSYKKVLIVSPRDFVYLKYSNSWQNEYWDLSFSVPYDLVPNKVRGEIILSACKVTENSEGIQVQVYSEVDMKLTVNPKITKNQAINEIRKYVDKCDEYVRANYRKEIV